MEEKNINVEEVSINETPNEPTDNATPDVTPHPTVTGADTPQTTDCGTQVDTLVAEVRELNDKFLRTAAELENTRRRAALDCESAARNRAMNVARQFLPVMDAIAAALKHNPDDEGIKSMARAMDAAFAQIGIVPIISVGEVLNPQFHNAIQAIDCKNMENKPTPNTIVEEMQTGYMFGDSVLRTAMVIVAK